MITINLLPPDLRKTRKKGGLKFNLPLEVVFGVGGGLLALVVLVHLMLLLTQITRIITKKSIEGQMHKIAANKKVVDEIISELRDLQSNYNTVDGFTKREVWWSQRLNIISDSMPTGVWVRRIMVDAGTLQIDGSAVLKQNIGMGNVHNFVSNLKGNKQFLIKLSNMELGSINTRTVNRTDVADFFIKAKVDEN
jgi:Tfp pilus assembly protein PilN